MFRVELHLVSMLMVMTGGFKDELNTQIKSSVSLLSGGCGHCNHTQCL